MTVTCLSIMSRRDLSDQTVSGRMTVPISTVLSPTKTLDQTEQRLARRGESVRLSNLLGPSSYRQRQYCSESNSLSSTLSVLGTLPTIIGTAVFGRSRTSVVDREGMRGNKKLDWPTLKETPRLSERSARSGSTRRFANTIPAPGT